MLDFYQRRKIKGVLLTPVTRVVLLILVSLLAYSAYTRYEIATQMEERRNAAEAEVMELEKQKRLLEEKVEYLSTERGIEAELRRQFDVTLPGEEVVVIMDDEVSDIQPLGTTSSEKKKAWYKFWE